MPGELPQRPEDRGDRFFRVADRDAVALRIRDQSTEVAQPPPGFLAGVECLVQQVLNHLRLGGRLGRGGPAEVGFEKKNVLDGPGREMPAPAGVYRVKEPEAPPVGREEPVQTPAEGDKIGDDRQQAVEDDELLRERADFAALEQDDLVAVNVGAPQQQAEQQRRLADPPGARHQRPAAGDGGAAGVQAGGGGMSVEHEVGNRKLQMEDAGVELRGPAVDLPVVPQLKDRICGEHLDLEFADKLAHGFGTDGDLTDPAPDLLPIGADVDQVVEDAVAAG